MKTRILSSIALTLLLLTCFVTQAQEPGYCCITDRIDDPAWHLSGGLVFETDIDEVGAGDFSMLEGGAEGGLAFFRTDIGEFDIRADVYLAVLMDDGDIDLPDQLLDLTLDAEWLAKVADATSLRLAARPGMHTDMEDLSGDSFFFPLSVEAVHAFHPGLSALVGVAVFPDFDQTFDPRFGVRWIPSREWVLDLQYPASRITFQPSIDWSVSIGLTMDKTSEYQLDDKDDRERLMIDQNRLYVEGEWALSENTRFMCQLGRVMGRSFDFEESAGDFDVDDTFYFRVGVGGMI